jgi:hypothetical protein
LIADPKHHARSSHWEAATAVANDKPVVVLALEGTKHESIYAAPGVVLVSGIDALLTALRRVEADRPPEDPFIAEYERHLADPRVIARRHAKIGRWVNNGTPCTCTACRAAAFSVI